MRRALAAAAVLAFALSPALAGCTDDDGQPPTPTDSSPPPSGHTTTPGSTTSDPADEPPVLPDAAKAQTTAGAKAFVRYYADVLNYAWAQGSPEELRQISARSCETCGNLSEFIQKVSEAGGFQHGGEWVVESVGAVPGQPVKNPTVLPLVRVEPGEWKRREAGNLMQIKRHKVNLQIELLWQRGAWMIANVSS
jgi:hypothetical protein